MCSVVATSTRSSTTSAEYSGSKRSNRETYSVVLNKRSSDFGSTSCSAMSLRTAGGAPMYICPTPSGSTISCWSASLTVRPVTRRITSPTR